TLCPATLTLPSSPRRRITAALSRRYRVLAPTRPARPARPARPDRPARPAHPDRPEHSDRPDSLGGGCGRRQASELVVPPHVACACGPGARSGTSLFLARRRRPARG